MLLKQSSWFCVGRRAVTSHSLQLSGLLCETAGHEPQDVSVGFVGSFYRQLLWLVAEYAATTPQSTGKRACDHMTAPLAVVRVRTQLCFWVCPSWAVLERHCLARLELC